jgi:hypothetical protein
MDRPQPYETFCPQTNGSVERYNRTLFNEWAYARRYRSEAARTQALDKWLHMYNHHRHNTGHRGPTHHLRQQPGGAERLGVVEDEVLLAEDDGRTPEVNEGTLAFSEHLPDGPPGFAPGGRRGPVVAVVPGVGNAVEVLRGTRLGRTPALASAGRVWTCT